MPTTNTSGRRKTAVARIYLTDGNGAITVNGKDYKEYFPTLPLQYIVTQSQRFLAQQVNSMLK
jgi:small subunit ribosomal protein S9